MPAAVDPFNSNPMEQGKCSSLVIINMLASDFLQLSNSTKIVRFEQHVSGKVIHWSVEELLKKPLIDLLAMENLYYIIK